MRQNPPIPLLPQALGLEEGSELFMTETTDPWLLNLGTARLDFNQSISPAQQLCHDPARKRRDGAGEPGTSQSVTLGRADINSPHREVGN